jgi:diguanylate cyclase (GGDEF)-like protein
MNNTVFRIWDRLGITSKLGFGFFLLFVFFAMAIIAGYIGLAVVRGAEADILSNMEIRHKVLEMEGQLEKARRLYRDFVLQAPEIGFAQAQEFYCRPALAVAARVIAISEDLKRRLAASRPSGEIAKRNVDLNLFSSTAQRFSQTLLHQTELLATLGDPQTGLEVELTSIMERVTDVVAASKWAVLSLREADVLEKQYRLTHQRPYMQAALNKIEVVKRALPQLERLTPEHRDEAGRMFDAYVAVAAKILNTVVAMTANTNDFALQAKAVDPISDELKILSAAEVEGARGRIEWASRIAGSIILVSALLGLGCVIIVGRILHASITSKIVAMTRHAADIRAGHLDVVVANTSRDELGVLADAFNAMTRRIRDLVENLEEKVRQRTRELAVKNHELDVKNQTLKILSQTDRLTGLCNRRKLDQALTAEWRRAIRYGTPFSVIMVDLDNFKNVNDNHGHEVGDAVLVCVADILIGMSRETDIVGRWGGEEFLLICPETGLEEAYSLAQNLRLGIESMVFPTIGRHLTASFGVAEYVSNLKPDLLVRQADEAMYRAKQAGRNSVEIVLAGPKSFEEGTAP